MAGKPINGVAMSAAERQRRRRAKLKAARDGVGSAPADHVTRKLVTRKPQNSRPAHQFPPGVSGNPGGRPRALRDVQAIARQHTPQAIAALVQALDDERYRVSAAAHLLDRAWGKPAPHLELDGTERITSLVLTVVAARDQPPNAGEANTPRIIAIPFAGDE